VSDRRQGIKGPMVKAIDIGGRVMPHDNDAEQGVLGTCIASPAAMQEVRPLIASDCFHSSSHSRIWTVLEYLDDGSKPINTVAIAAELRARGWEDIGDGGSGGIVRGMLYLARIAECAGDPSHAAAWATHLAELATKRRIIEASQFIAGEGYAGTTVPAAEFAGWSTDKMTRACDAKALSSLQHIGDVANELDDDLRAQWSGTREPWGMRLPLPQLHGMLHGLGLGEVTFIGALEAGGKSVLAEQIALHVAGQMYEGEPCGVTFLTLEMPKKTVAARAACHIARLSWRQLQTGTNPDGSPVTTEDVARLDDAFRALRVMPFDVDDADKDLTRIRAAARQSQARLRTRGAKLRLIVIDHVHILDLDDDRYTQALASCVRGFKRIAVEFGAHVLALAQFTQEAARRDGAPLVGDIKDASAIKQIADKILLIHRPWAKLTDKDSPDADEIKDHAEIHLGKNRNGALGVIPVRFVGEHFRFEECDRPALAAKARDMRRSPGRSRYAARGDAPRPPGGHS